MKLPFFKKADIILLVVLILIGAGSLLLLTTGEKGSTAVVTVDGRELIRLPLMQESYTEIVESVYGTNTYVIENGSVRMTDSDCRGGDCMRMRPISRAGEMIVCLPHHLTITIIGEDGPDAVIH